MPPLLNARGHSKIRLIDRLVGASLAPHQRCIRWCAKLERNLGEAVSVAIRQQPEIATHHADRIYTIPIPVANYGDPGWWEAIIKCQVREPGAIGVTQQPGSIAVHPDSIRSIPIPVTNDWSIT